jgi:hypothetical protein
MMPSPIPTPLPTQKTLIMINEQLLKTYFNNSGNNMKKGIVMSMGLNKEKEDE